MINAEVFGNNDGVFHDNAGVFHDNVGVLNNSPCLIPSDMCSDTYHTLRPIPSDEALGSFGRGV